MKTFPQFTLRELLFAVLFVALGLASLRAGGVLASITIMLAIVLSMGMAIIAFVGRGELQAFAIGFSIPVVAYAATIAAAGSSEFDPTEGNLPTSKMLLPLFNTMTQEIWIDDLTGEVIPDFDPAKDTYRGSAGFGSAVRSNYPDRQTFMTVGQVLAAMFFGYTGGKFAVLIYRRRVNK